MTADLAEIMTGQGTTIVGTTGGMTVETTDDSMTVGMIGTVEMTVLVVIMTGQTAIGHLEGTVAGSMCLGTGPLSVEGMIDMMILRLLLLRKYKIRTFGYSALGLESVSCNSS